VINAPLLTGAPTMAQPDNVVSPAAKEIVRNSFKIKLLLINILELLASNWSHYRTINFYQKELAKSLTNFRLQK
jgi:hypothetical protein